MEKIAATKVQHLLRCTEKYNLRKTKIKLFTSNSNQIVRLDGIILHALMEDLINSRNYSPSSQEIKDLIINEEKKHFEDELLYTSLDFIRTQSIVDAVKTHYLIFKINLILMNIKLKLKNSMLIMIFSWVLLT